MRFLFLALALVVAMPIGFAADHRESPALLNSAAVGARDINDVYVFQAAAPTSTVLVLTVSPAAGVIGPDVFATDVIYQFNLVDTPAAPGFAADIAYRITFATPDTNRDQAFSLYHATGSAADGHTLQGSTLVHTGTTNQISPVPTGGQFFAGLRSDPFFFDFNAFLGSVEGLSIARRFNDGGESDYFATRNVLALVLELPDGQFPDASGDGFAVWGSTAVENGGGFDQADRIGRPLINSLVNSTGSIVGAPAANKDLFNEVHPVSDAAFEQAADDALVALSAPDTEGSYTSAERIAIRNILLPDLLQFDKDISAGPPFNAGPFNGRRLEEDVVDVVLNFVSGGFPFSGRDGQGAFASDGIGPHRDYLSVFPYLGPPHSNRVFGSGFESGEGPPPPRKAVARQRR